MLGSAELFPSTPSVSESVTRASVRDIDALVAADRLETLYERTPKTLVGGLFFSAILASGCAATAGFALAWGWFGFKLLTALVRAWDGLAFANALARRTHLRHWHRRHAWGSFFDGLGWGAVGLLFIPSGDATRDGLLIASLVGVASAGVFTLTSHVRDGVRFMCCVLVPLMLNAVTSHWSSMPWLIAAGGSTYLAVLWLECARAGAHMRELLRLRYENAAIAEERERAWRTAERNSAAKSHFLATVSHELRTPLNGILGMAQLMAHDQPTATQGERLGVVRQSAMHLLTLIDDLLDVSRVEFGRLTLRPSPTRLRPMMHEVVDLLTPIAHDKGLILACEVAPEVPESASLDAARVKQVLHNLLGNALKFTEHGEVRLTAQRDGAHLVMTVSDTGCGVAPESRERIFDAFEQGAVDRRAGTGLGLTISRQLARAMGGDIVVSNSPSGGAVFVFSLDHQAADDAQVEAAVDEAGSARAPAPLAGHVLVVEDNPVNAQVATAMLAQLGLQTELAEDGQQALASLNQEHFDLVLLDCQMPVLDGWETARRWRQHEADNGSAHLPIIALTANALAGDRERCLAAGMDDYLAKPFTRSALADMLARHLPRRAD